MKKNEHSVDHHLGCSGEFGRNSLIVVMSPQTILAYFSIAMTVVMTKLFFCINMRAED